MMAGDWTTFASAACNAGRPVNLSGPFANNRIDPSLYSRPAVIIVSKLPKPQDECGKIVYSVPDNSNEYQMSGKRTIRRATGTPSLDDTS